MSYCFVARKQEAALGTDSSMSKDSFVTGMDLHSRQVSTSSINEYCQPATSDLLRNAFTVPSVCNFSLCEVSRTYIAVLSKEYPINQVYHQRHHPQ